MYILIINKWKRAADKMDVLSTILKNELKPGETIIWQGQPDLGLFFKKAWRLPAILISFSIGFLLVINERGGSLLSIRAIIWWGFVVIVIHSVIQNYFKLKKRHYVVTDQRALVITPPTVVSHTKEIIGSYTKVCRSDGSGYIRFTRGRFGESFLWLKDVTRVADIINRVAKT